VLLDFVAPKLSSFSAIVVVFAVYSSLKTFACLRTGRFAPAICIQTSFSFTFPRVSDLSLFFLPSKPFFSVYWTGVGAAGNFAL
jgi:hypothetical protein